MNDPQDEIERKISCSLETIREIGATGIPIITVLNKIDLLSTESLTQKTESLKKVPSNLVPVSALRKTNLDLLKEGMAKCIKTHEQSSFTVPVNANSMSFLSWVFKNADVHNVVYEKDSVTVSFGAPPQLIEKIRGRVEEFGGTLTYG